MADERKLFEKQFHSLYNHYHSKKSGFKIKEAIFLNQQKIQIFKGEDFIKFTTTNFSQIEPLVPERQKDAQSLARYLIENKIILRLDRHPEDPQKRWPRKLVLIKNQIFAEEGFFTWNIVVKNKMNNVKMTMILLLVFLVCLYPIWPFAFKYGIFKLTLYLCVFFTGLLVVRLIVYIVSRLFGYSFWILPNINDDTQGILGSFKPLYSIYKFTDGTLEILLRLIGIISFIGLIYFIIQEPQYITGFQEASGQTIDDILDWGKEKLEGKQEPLHRRAIPDLSDLMKEAEQDLQNSTETNTTQSDL